MTPVDRIAEALVPVLHDTLATTNASAHYDFVMGLSRRLAEVIAALDSIEVVELPEGEPAVRIHGASSVEDIYDVSVCVPREFISHRSLDQITNAESTHQLGVWLLAAARSAGGAE